MIQHDASWPPRLCCSTCFRIFFAVLLNLLPFQYVAFGMNYAWTVSKSQRFSRKIKRWVLLCLSPIFRLSCIAKTHSHTLAHANTQAHIERCSWPHEAAACDGPREFQKVSVKYRADLQLHTNTHTSIRCNKLLAGHTTQAQRLNKKTKKQHKQAWLAKRSLAHNHTSETTQPSVLVFSLDQWCSLRDMLVNYI